MREDSVDVVNVCRLLLRRVPASISRRLTSQDFLMTNLLGPAIATVALFLVSSATAQEPIRMARTPDLSPDGKLIAFSYLGDIWVVEAIGGVARPVTQHVAHDYHPRFSPDGRWIAFASKRHGSYDVFVVSSRGGKPRRLTFDSA